MCGRKKLEGKFVLVGKNCNPCIHFFSYYVSPWARERRKWHRVVGHGSVLLMGWGEAGFWRSDIHVYTWEPGEASLTSVKAAGRARWGWEIWEAGSQQAEALWAAKSGRRWGSWGEQRLVYKHPWRLEKRAWILGWGFGGYGGAWYTLIPYWSAGVEVPALPIPASC